MIPSPVGPGASAPSATEIARRIREGRASVESVLRDCLERIESREPEVQAWVSLDVEHALEQARALDRGPYRGPLHGVPIGVKDVLDTGDFPTGRGSPIHAGRQPTADASAVARVRAAGAVILGKTVTCEFADLHPGPTRNPAHLGHTPGGSSSGSAAAVSDGMVPVAFGTQTAGSILRPASFCGIFGFKPTYNTINRQGLFFSAESLDTIGLFARNLDDLDLVSAVLCDRPPVLGSEPPRPPRIGLCRTPLWDRALPETQAAVEDAADQLSKGGAEIQDVQLTGDFLDLSDAALCIHAFERARALSWEWEVYPNRISSGLHEAIERGRSRTRAEWVAAQEIAERCRGQLDAILSEFDLLLAPCAPGEAPAGLEYTGDPTLQRFWTALHGPLISLPTHTGPRGLPVGTQWVGRRHRDAELLRSAGWVWSQLHPGPVGFLQD
jgi:Asp-tRNA(Asn)/Glu-tRNA(Gln) amidotransferase A subunit family amidase